MKIGRNDLCSCGSNKKYKKCCMNRKQNRELMWKDNFDKINIEVDKREELKEILFCSYDFVKDNNWQGACHALSAIQYILLNELKINPKICIGIVQYDRYTFDHSWIEINDQVYDIAIYNGLEDIKISEPIVAGLNIETLERTNVKYGVEGKFDYPASVIKDIDIKTYMDGSPNDELWKVVVDFGKKINLNLSIDKLRDKYSTTKRTVI